jgi:hypothetical protein
MVGTVAATVKLIDGVVAVWGVGEVESVTLITIPELVPVVVGVPVTAHVEAFKLKPAGKLPEVNVQVYGFTPPVIVMPGAM